MYWPSYFLIGIFMFHLPPTLDMIRLAKENKRTSSTKNAINKSKIAQKWQIRAWRAQMLHFPCNFRSDVWTSTNNVEDAWKTCKTRKHCKSSDWKSPGGFVGTKSRFLFSSSIVFSFFGLTVKNVLFTS